MNTDKDGGNAFPIPGLQDDPDFNGMSLRDYFAAKAMQGWLASFGPTDSPKASSVANLAYGIADAMLAARGEA
jgi:hypothetical protein